MTLQTAQGTGRTLSYIGRCARARVRGRTRGCIQETVNPRRRRLESRQSRGMRLGALTHWLPAKSYFFESAPRRTPRAPPPSRAGRERWLRFSPSTSRGHKSLLPDSPLRLPSLSRERAEHERVSLDGRSPAGLYLDDGVLRGVYLKNREERLSLSPSFPSCADLSFSPSSSSARIFSRHVIVTQFFFLPLSACPPLFFSLFLQIPS